MHNYNQNNKHLTLIIVLAITIWSSLSIKSVLAKNGLLFLVNITELMKDGFGPQPLFKCLVAELESKSIE